MDYSKFNESFLNHIDDDLKQSILKNIADLYNVTKKDVYIELTSDPAEHIIEYISGSLRSKVWHALNNFSLNEVYTNE